MLKNVYCILKGPISLVGQSDANHALCIIHHHHHYGRSGRPAVQSNWFMILALITSALTNQVNSKVIYTKWNIYATRKAEYNWLADNYYILHLPLFIIGSNLLTHQSRKQTPWPSRNTTNSSLIYFLDTYGNWTEVLLRLLIMPSTESDFLQGPVTCTVLPKVRKYFYQL